MKSIRRNSRLVVDQLESRFLLAAVFWDGGGDGVLWRTAANWSNNTLPTADDDVTIDVAGNPSIVYDGLQVFPYNVTIRSLVCNESFSIRSPLTVTNGVAINSAVTTRGEEFRIDNGLTLNGSITSETYSGDIGVRLILGGDQAFIAGTGTITSTDENDRLIITNATSVNNVSQTMTIGANISMATRRFAQIGSNAGGTVVNNGHLSVVGPEQLNDVGRLGGVNQQFINNGTMSFVDTITSLYNVVNSPTGSITAQEGQLNFNADEGNEGPFSWDNNGSISTTETLVSFLDTFEFEDIGNFTVTGGMARVGGTMQNIGRIATLTESIPELYLVGSINGGTVNAIGSASIVSSSAWINGVTRSGMLYGVTLNAPLRVSSGHEIQIRNGLTLNSTITLGAANQDIDASVEFSGASHQTLNGTGSILSLGTGECGVINSQRNLTTGQGFDLTIGSEIKINLAKNSYVHTSYGKTTNYGVITFQGTGGPTFTGSARMSTSREFRNYGTIRAFNSVSVNLDHLVNEVGGVIEANASRMIFREQSASISWNNDGVLNNVGGEFQFTGNFTWDDIGAFTRSGNSVMRIVGTLDNTGQTREFNDQTGDWIITGGTILNGTVTTTSGHQLIPQGATFIDVTINTDLTVTDATSIFIHNSLTLNGTIKFVSPSSNGNRLYFRGTGMTVMGVGQIRFETLASAGLYNECIVNSVPQPLVFGAGIDLRLDASTSIIAGTGATTRLDGHMLMVGNTVSDIRIGSTGSKFINNGSIEITNNAKVIIYGFQNNTGATFDALNSSVAFYKGSLSGTDVLINQGAFDFEDSTLIINDSLNWMHLNTHHFDNTALVINGNVALGGIDLDSTGQIPSIKLVNGVLTGGTLSGESLLAIHGGSIVDLVINIPVNVQPASMTIGQGVVLNSTMTILNASAQVTLNFAAPSSMTFAGNGTVESQPAGILKLNYVPQNTNPTPTLTFGPELTIQFGKTGSITGVGGAVLNQGEMKIDGHELSNATFTIGTSTLITRFTNAGTMNFSGSTKATVREWWGQAGAYNVMDEGTQLSIIGGTYEIDGNGVIGSKAWVDYFGNWTIGAGADIAGTAVFKHATNNANTYAAVRQAVISGYANGAWNGAGLRDTVAGMNVEFTLGYAPASVVSNSSGLFHDVAVDASATIVHHTLDGDVNLDGTVAFGDILTVAQNYSQSNRDFYQGDINFDSVITFADLLRVSQQYGSVASVLRSGRASHDASRSSVAVSVLV